MTAKKIVLFAFAVSLFIVFTSLSRSPVPIPMPKSAGPPNCYAGEAPNHFNCTNADCHEDGTPNTGSAIVTIDLGAADSGYVPGTIYTVTISIEKPGMVRAGFQCIALMDSDLSRTPGIITLTDVNRTQQIDSTHLYPHPGGCNVDHKVWVEHTYNGTTVVSPGLNTWSYQWQAPSSDIGGITFYLASLQSNNSLDETGDLAYTRQKTITAILPDTTSSISENELEKRFSVFPNPVADILTVETTLSLKTQYIIYDLTGTAKQTGSFVRRKEIDVTELAEGVYLIRIETAQGSFIKKFVCYSK